MDIETTELALMFPVDVRVAARAPYALDDSELTIDLDSEAVSVVRVVNSVWKL
jgi:hypothetical protein